MVARSPGGPGTSLSQSPLWSGVLDAVDAQISGERHVRGPALSSLESTASALARAHSRSLVALESAARIDQPGASQLASEAVDLLLAVAAIWRARGAREEDRRAALADQLRQRLAAQEDAVLAGEVTYRLASDHAHQPSAAMRRAIAGLSHRPPAAEADLLYLRIAAVDLAAVLVRLAANAIASGHAAEAPEPRSDRLDAGLRAVMTELAAGAEEVEWPAADHGDVVAHHLAAGLRVDFAPELTNETGDGASATAAPRDDLEGVRAAWLGLAIHEYAAVTALDAQRKEPTYDERFGSLQATVVEGAANVICGGRLLGRPATFRHRQAWRHQSVALTYALEAYVAGLRGHAPSLAQAQLITLTRLSRASVALVLIDCLTAAA